MMPVQNADIQRMFQEFLQKEFERRNLLNSSYSLRAFARDLKLDQSLLSKILKGKASIRWETMKKSLSSLLVPYEVIEIFEEQWLLFSSEFSSLHKMDYDAFSCWRKLAIIEFLKINNKASFDMIADYLHLSKSEVIADIDALIQKGFLKKIQDQFRILRPNIYWNAYDDHSLDWKTFSKSILKRNIDCIDGSRSEFLHHCVLAIAIDKHRLPEFKEKLNSLLVEFGKFANKTNLPNEVYLLSMSFFPVKHK
jgi:predicted transcriptional regulator